MATIRKATGKGAARVLVLSGPNLDRLGRREPHIYGTSTLADIHGALERLAAASGADVDCRQTNHEGLLVDWIGAAADDGFDGILLNAAAYTHTSYAIMDAIKMVGLPTVEVHVSNPDAREEFRHSSTIAPVVKARVAGFGPASYTVALSGLLDLLGASARPTLKPRSHRPRARR